MQVNTDVFTALAERIEQMDRQLQAVSSSLSAAYQAAGRPEIGADLDRIVRGRHRARLRLIDGGRS